MSNKEAILAAGTIVAFELTAGKFTVVNGIRSFGALGETGEAKDQTTLADTTKRYGRGLKDTAEQTIKSYHYPLNTDQETFIDKAVAQELTKMKVIYPSGRQGTVDLQLLGFQMDENTAEDWETFTVQSRQSGATEWIKPSAASQPSQFTFVDQTDAALSTEISSAPVVLTGMTGVATIAVLNGSYSINGGTFTTDIGIVENGDSIVVKVTSSAANSTAVVATVNIAGITDDFSVTTVA